MVTAIIFLAIALVCAAGIVREVRRKNFFAVGFAGITFVVFGWFSIATIIAIVTTGGGAPVSH